MPKINKGYSNRLSLEELSQRSQRRCILNNQNETYLARNIIPVDVEVNNIGNVSNNNNSIVNREVDNHLKLFNSFQISNSNTTITDFFEQSNSFNQIPIINNYEEQVNSVNAPTLKTELCKWAIECKIPHNHLNLLLSILRKYKICEDTLLKDARTLLSTSNKIENIRFINSNEKYFHFGLIKALEMHYSNRKDIGRL